MTTDTVVVDACYYSIPIARAIDLEPRLKSLAIGKRRSRIDLGDPLALKLYNQTVLRVKYDLDIDVPAPYLIPTIGMRAAFLSWIIDPCDIHVMEIGTGASAIMALLAERVHGKRVTATEVNPGSLTQAELQLFRNGSNVELRRSTGQILQGMLQSDDDIDLVFSFPPFYPADDGFGKLKKKRGFGGVQSELYDSDEQEEGEVGFVQRLISEFVKSEQVRKLAVLFLKSTEAHRAIEHANATAAAVPETLTVSEAIIKAGTRTRSAVMFHKPARADPQG